MREVQEYLFVLQCQPHGGDRQEWLASQGLVR